jgi:glycine oxidase
MQALSMDVLVVGGGVIGASIAWRLARQHARVMLFDVASVGAEASSAAAGMLAPAGEFDDPSKLEFALSSLAKYPDYAASIESDSRCAVDLRHPGAVEVAVDEEEFRALAERAARHRGYGVRSQILSARQLRELVPLLREDAVGGIHYPDELTVDPQALMKALQAACLARGAILVEGAPVVSVTAGAHSVRAALPDRTFEAAFAVIAAGAWSQDITVSLDGAPHALPRSFPVKGHLVGYRLGAGSLGATVRHGDTYLLQRAGGFTVAGSSMENVEYDRSINAGVVADIRARAARLLPALDGLEPERTWTGFRPATTTSEPHVGRIASSRVWLAYGHYRNGILLAPATSDRVAQEIKGSLTD